MKISMPIVMTLVSVSVFLPLIYFIFIGEKEATKKKLYFNKLLKKENLKLNHKETWNNNFIGLDEVQKKLIFIKLSPRSIPTIVDLNDINACQIIKTGKQFKKDKKIETSLEKIDLEISYLSKKPYLNLNFYDTNESFSENLEMIRAEKWRTLIITNCRKQGIDKTAA